MSERFSQGSGKKTFLQAFTPFDLFLVAGITAANAVYSFLCGNIDAAGTVTAVSGVLCVVLVARGNIWNYLFGLVNVSLYAWISFRSGLYGDAALNALYYLPMQFIGYAQWRRRGAGGASSPVRARRLSRRQRLLLFLSVAVLTAAAGLLLQRLGDPQPYKDAATTVLSVAAQFLMAAAYAEQWLLWIVTNILSVAMWSVLAVEGEPHSVIMVLMWVFYLMNSVNGYRIWLRLSRPQVNDIPNRNPA